MPKKLLFSVTLADCRVDTFRSGGKGGQNQNKRDTGVRITHLASGAVGESREERTQFLNKRKAFVKMANSKKFKAWNKIEAARRGGWDIEEKVDKEMEPGNLKIEVRNSEGHWENSDV